MFEVEESVFEEMLKTYNRNVKMLKEDVKVLKNWMEEQKHFPEVLDDKRLENFFLLNKCSIQRAKEKIDNYYTMKTLMPDIYERFNPKFPEFQKSRELVYFVPTLKLTKEKYRLFFFKIHNKNIINELQVLPLILRTFHIEEIRLAEDRMFGNVFVYDMEGMNLSLLLKVTPIIAAKTTSIYEKVFSIPLKAIYIINSKPIIDVVLKIFQKLLKPKLFQRIYVCENTQILHEVFQKDEIPEDYGGTMKPLKTLQDMLDSKIEQFQERFDKFDNLKVNESLRPEKLMDDEILGFYGNFKQLDID